MLSESYLQAQEVSRVHTQVPACFRSGTLTVFNVMNLLQQACVRPFQWPGREEAEQMNDLQLTMRIADAVMKVNPDDFTRVFSADSKVLVDLYLSDVEHFTEDSGLQRLEIEHKQSFTDYYYYVHGEDGAAVNFVVAWIQQVLAADERICKSFFGQPYHSPSCIRIIHQHSAPCGHDYEEVMTLAQTAWSHGIIWESFDSPYRVVEKVEIDLLSRAPAEIRSTLAHALLHSRCDLSLSWHEKDGGFGCVSVTDGKWSFHVKKA